LHNTVGSLDPSELAMNEFKRWKKKLWSGEQSYRNLR
jgi:hypothetical protein